MDADGNSEEPSLLVLVRFKTDLGHPYKVPESSISIPASLTRFGLSTVANNLITSGNPDWESEPFDFLIKNELVRMSLEKFLLAKNISAERILEIEYIRLWSHGKKKNLLYIMNGLVQLMVLVPGYPPHIGKD